MLAIVFGCAGRLQLLRQLEARLLGKKQASAICGHHLQEVVGYSERRSRLPQLHCLGDRAVDRDQQASPLHHLGKVSGLAAGGSTQVNHEVVGRGPQHLGDDGAWEVLDVHLPWKQPVQRRRVRDHPCRHLDAQTLGPGEELGSADPALAPADEDARVAAALVLLQRRSSKRLAFDVGEDANGAALDDASRREEHSAHEDVGPSQHRHTAALVDDHGQVLFLGRQIQHGRLVVVEITQPLGGRRHMLDDEQVVEVGMLLHRRRLSTAAAERLFPWCQGLLQLYLDSRP
mmetsp:Transcript_16832/g.64094  ORF Transcript_16832/g.64094 Transcript_16832/m.64094 type:complete len:288 (+) Transcript_16832:807-1670(+)